MHVYGMQEDHIYATDVGVNTHLCEVLMETTLAFFSATLSDVGTDNDELYFAKGILQTKNTYSDSAFCSFWCSIQRRLREQR